MTEHLKNAEDEIELARLLSERVGARNDDVREQVRERIEIARAELNLAEDELDYYEGFATLGGKNDE